LIDTSGIEVAVAGVLALSLDIAGRLDSDGNRFGALGLLIGTAKLGRLDGLYPGVKVDAV
jgi:hypothetical protein